MRSQPRVGTLQQAHACSKSFRHWSSLCTFMGCQNTQRIPPPRQARRWATCSSVDTWISVTPPRPQPVRTRLVICTRIQCLIRRSSSRASSTSPAFRLWDASCPSQKSLFPTGSSPPSTCCCGPPPGATSIEFQRALLCPTCSVGLPHWSLPKSWANAKTPIGSVAARLPAYSSASAVLVATKLCCFVQALIKYFPCKIMHPLTDFIDCLSPSISASARACKALRLACHSNKHQNHGLPTKSRPNLFMFFRSSASSRDNFEHSLLVATVMSGRSWDK